MSVEDGLLRYRDRFEVTTASNGVQALGVIESRDPALVVSDMRMPKMDGIELLLNCRRLYPRLPVILVSAYFSEELERNARSFGAAAVLHKPLDLNVLVDAIIGVLDQKEMRGDSQGYLENFDLVGFFKLLGYERRTCTLALRASNGAPGKLWFESGQLIDASVGDLDGREAALEILGWRSADITMLESSGARAQRITETLRALLAQAEIETSGRESDFPEMPKPHTDQQATARTTEVLEEPLVIESSEPPRPDQSRDFMREAMMTPSQSPAPPTTSTAALLEEWLSQLLEVTGFMAAGFYTSEGELLAEVLQRKISMIELGAFATDVLQRAKKATSVAGGSTTESVHIAASEVNIIVRPGTPSVDTRRGYFLVLVLEESANVAMAKLVLERLCDSMRKSMLGDA